MWFDKVIAKTIWCNCSCCRYTVTRRGRTVKHRPRRKTGGMKTTTRASGSRGQVLDDEMTAVQTARTASNSKDWRIPARDPGTPTTDTA